MTPKVLTDALLKHGQCTKDKNVFKVADDAVVTLYVNVGQSMLTIRGVSSFELDDDIFVAQVPKEGCWVCAYEDITAIHSQKKRRGVGYA